MNDNGTLIDTASVKTVLRCIAEYEETLLTEFVEITGGEPSSPRQVQATLDFLATQGLNLPDLRAGTVDDALSDVWMSESARRILEIRRSLSKSSTAKFQKMLDCACSDGRVRGTHLYHGADTGRWAGKLLQTQNLPRGSINDDDNPLASEAGLFSLVHCGVADTVAEYGDLMGVASSVIRNCIVAAPGNVLMVGDYAQIEARVLPWLAGQQKTLDEFEAGRDLYKVAASGTFAVNYQDVTKAQRQVGKGQILGLGFGGGIGAFVNMAKTYGIDLAVMVPEVMSRATFEEIEQARNCAEFYFTKQRERGIEPEITEEQAIAVDIVKQRWRHDNDLVVMFWRGLEDAAIKAVETEIPHAFGPVMFGLRGTFLHMRLPSGRLLAYPEPRVVKVKTPWGEERQAVSAMRMNSMTNKWERRKMYGGLYAENATQAVARDVLAEAMVKLDKAGYKLTMSVHDEVVAEMPESNADLAEFERIISANSVWAKGLPIGVDCWQGTRYRK